MRTQLKLGLGVTLLFLPLALAAADWPQWGGPERTGVSPEKGLLKTWPKGGPKLLWTFKNAGTGFTAPAVIGDVVFTMGSRDKQEFLIALDGGGKELWAPVKIGPEFDFKGNQWSGGPNATPSVDKDLIYALGSSGDLACVSTKGEIKWQTNLPKNLGGWVNNVTSPGPPNMGWGYSWSPLIDGDNLIITPGGPQGLFAALNKKTGAVVWQSKDVKEACTYASPLVAEVKGVRQYIAFVQDGLVGVDAKSGALLWRYLRKPAYNEIIACTPVFSNDHVFFTGQGGGELVQIASTDGKTFTATSKVKSRELVNLHGGIVLIDKTMYGCNAEGSWKAVDFMKPNKALWDSGRDGAPGGSIIAADGLLFIVSADDGSVSLLEASPKAYSEKGTFKLPEHSKLRKVSGKYWSHPVVANGRLYVRDQDLIFCYEVK